MIDNDTNVVFFKCDTVGCTKYYPSLSQLNLHKKSHNKPYKCLYGICNKSFSRNTDLKLHLLTVHKNKGKDGQEICKFCKNTFRSKSSLLKHVDNIHGEIQKKFVCKRCHKQFRRKDELQNHFKSHLSMDMRKIFKCNDCPSSFTLKSNLQKHLRKFH